MVKITKQDIAPQLKRGLAPDCLGYFDILSGKLTLSADDRKAIKQQFKECETDTEQIWLATRKLDYSKITLVVAITEDLYRIRITNKGGLDATFMHHLKPGNGIKTTTSTFFKSANRVLNDLIRGTAFDLK